MGAGRTKRMDARFRLGWLIFVLLLVAALFVTLRLQQADGRLREAVIQNDLDAAKSALRDGARRNCNQVENVASIQGELVGLALFNDLSK